MVVPAVLSLYKHVNRMVTTLKYLAPTALVLRDSLIARFEGLFARVGMAHSINLEKSPFASKIYFLATILDPNYQLYWVEEVSCDAAAAEDIGEEQNQILLRAKLRGMSNSTAYIGTLTLVTIMIYNIVKLYSIAKLYIIEPYRI